MELSTALILFGEREDNSGFTIKKVLQAVHFKICQQVLTISSFNSSKRLFDLLITAGVSMRSFSLCQVLFIIICTLIFLDQQELINSSYIECC